MASRLRRGLIRLAYVAFASKLLIPVGYMPAALGGGSLVMLCPGGLPAGLIEALGAHSGHGAADEHGSHDEAAVWEHCSLGALAATPALAAVPVLEPSEAAHDAVPSTRPLRPIPTRSLAFRARAPPQPRS